MSALPREKQVLGLDVAVNDPLFVSDREHVQQLVADRENLAGVEALPLAVPSCLDRLAVEKLHHEERRSVLCHIVVQDLHGARMLHGIREIALAKEARPDRLFPAELRVKHLHRDTILVPVGGCIHGSHAADSYERVETPLVLEHLAYTAVCSRARVVPVAHDCVPAPFATTRLLPPSTSARTAMFRISISTRFIFASAR